MKNGDLTAMPNAELDRSGVSMAIVNKGGLTKREMFAMAAMQGILAIGNKSSTEDIIASCAVRMADALLAELEKSK